MTKKVKKLIIDDLIDYYKFFSLIKMQENKVYNNIILKFKLIA
uniref:Uncharacterized protein n=1 Tax=Polysiphonia urceolata TaxID=173545 RepID=A0A1Z1MCD7_POLUR|nr:hypothetical protein [Polysiphonia stricta]ARW63485.1 hypothetical protein [Polysiphonia stricta]